MATFRGRKACACLIAWLPVLEKELLRRGVIKYNIDIYQLIGGAAKSGGTHRTGGAFDIAQRDSVTVKVAREMGAAFWNRPYNWDGRKGMAHAHGVLNGCPHNTPARYQIAALRLGRNGLGWMGLGGKDDGPPPRKLRTWQQGIDWAKAQPSTKEQDMPLTQTEINKIATAAAEQVWNRFQVHGTGDELVTLQDTLGRLLAASDAEQIAEAVWAYGIPSLNEDQNKGKKYPAGSHLAANNGHIWALVRGLLGK